MTADRNPGDVEARLRASLRAYAEVVDEAPARHPSAGTEQPGARTRPSAVRRWRAPVLVAAAVLAVAGGAWVVLDDPAAPSPTAAAPGSTTTEAGPEAAAAQPPEGGTSADARASEGMAAAAVGPGGQLVVLPPAVLGVTYPFDLYTHCGVFGADVAGIWFAVEPVLVEELGPPPGWGDPYQRGTLTLESAVEAVFRADAGPELTLRAAPESERPPPCD